MKGCGVPSKGNVGAREHAYSQCLIVPLSFLVAEGAVSMPEHRICDRRRTAGLMFHVHIHAALHILGLPPIGIFELCTIAHRDAVFVQHPLPCYSSNNNRVVDERSRCVSSIRCPSFQPLSVPYKQVLINSISGYELPYSIVVPYLFSFCLLHHFFSPI